MADGDAELAAAIALSLQSESRAAATAADQERGVPSAVARLMANGAATLAAKGTAPALRTLLENLARSPTEEKYSRIRTTNPRIAAAIVEVPGAVDILEAVGFRPRGDGTLEVPQDLRQAAGRTALQALAALEAAATEPATDTPALFLSRSLDHCGVAVRCVCFLPDGRLATGGADNIVRLWSTDSAAASSSSSSSPPVLLLGHQPAKGVSGVLSLACSATGLLASGGRDGAVLLWDGASGALHARLEGHGDDPTITNAGSVSCLAFCPKTRQLVSGGWDMTARVWAPPFGGPATLVLRGHTMAVNAAAFLPDGRILTGSGDGSLRIWDEGRCVGHLPGPSPVRGLAVVPPRPDAAAAVPAAAIASVTNDGALRLWTEDGILVASVQASPSYLFAVAVSTPRGLLVTGGDAAELKLWSIPDLRCLRTIRHPAEILAVSVAPNGDVAVGTSDGAARLWTSDPARQAPADDQWQFQVNSDLVHASGPAAASHSPPTGRFDFAVPVQLQGGRKMTLEWNRGEDPAAVAIRFCEANGLPFTHTVDIVTMIGQAEAAAPRGTADPSAAAAAGSVGFDFVFPVEVADGRRLELRWNRSDDPRHVAMTFALTHGIPSAELPDIEAFVRQVHGAPAAVPTAAPTARPDPAARAAIAAQLVAMGFPVDQVEAALLATGSASIEAALAALLKD